MPNSACELIDDGYGGEIYDHCYGIETFTGSWFQPNASDEYLETISRISAGDELYFICTKNNQWIYFD